MLHARLRDRTAAASGAWSYRRCPTPGCGLVWLDPMPTPDELRAAYSDYYTHVRPTWKWRPGYRLYLFALRATAAGKMRKRLELMDLGDCPPGRVLEIGCGNGMRLAHFRKHGWTAEGHEMDPVSARIAREHFGLTVHLEPLDSLPGGYDAVIMNHVVEHLTDPHATLSACHRLLRDGGRLSLITPNIDSLGHHAFAADWIGIDPPRHVYLFNRHTLQRTVERAGFRRITCTTTSVHAAGFAHKSLPALPFRSLRALAFQWHALRRNRRDPLCGEEVVLTAEKPAGGDGKCDRH